MCTRTLLYTRESNLICKRGKYKRDTHILSWNWHDAVIWNRLPWLLMPWGCEPRGRWWWPDCPPSPGTPPDIPHSPQFFPGTVGRNTLVVLYIFNFQPQSAPFCILLISITGIILGFLRFPQLCYWYVLIFETVAYLSWLCALSKCE